MSNFARNLGRFTLAATLTALLLAMLAGSAALTRAQEPERLVVYSGRSEGLIGPILEQFTAETGVQVDARYGGTTEMAATILEEGSGSPADIFIAQDAGALGALAAAELLAPLPSDVLERVDAPFRSTEGLWVGLSGRARVLVYNTEMLSEADLPASLLDLTRPAWAMRAGWAPANGSFQANVTALRVLLGDDAARDWLSGMVANGTQVYENNRAIVQAVADGEVEVGLVNHYYLWGFLDENPDFPAANYYFPGGDPGALVNIAGAGVVATSDQPGLAQRLILYLLGSSAQGYFSAETFEYPLAAGAAADERLAPLAEIDAPEIDLSRLDDLQGTLEMLQETGALP